MRIRMKVRKIACPDGNTPTIYEEGSLYEIPAELVPKLFKQDEYSAVEGEAKHVKHLTPEEQADLELEGRAVKAPAIVEEKKPGES